MDVTGARISCQRTLAWRQTDAAGHNHFSALFSWLEEAEHALWHALGHADLVPVVPRVHVEADYHRRLFFGAEVEVSLGVVRVGRCSCSFATRVTDSEGTVVQAARHTVVHAPGAAAPWADDIRTALSAPQRFREGAAPCSAGGL